MPPFYRGIVCISCQNRMDMGHLDEVSSLRGVVLVVVVRVYHDWQPLLDHWQPQRD